MASSKRLRIAAFSVVPSPYQRDLFAALADREEVQLDVYYLEAAAPDSPWPDRPLASYEQILPGFWFPVGGARVHVNWDLPDVRNFDLVIVNTLMSLTAQRLLRGPLRERPWIFFGERLGPRRRYHDWLTAPLHRAAAIAAVGTWAQRDYAERFPAARTFSLPYYCDLSAFLAAPRHPFNAEPVFLFCGQMIARKGVDVLLDAFSQLDRGRLLLVGREADLPQMLASLPSNVRERITYAGFQPPEALPIYFSQADVFILPSRHDGWGVVVNQALGAGLPVICSDQVGAGYDLVEENVNGARVRGGDVADLATAMRRFVNSPESIVSFGTASRAKAAGITPQAGAARWIDAIRTVLNHENIARQ